MSGSIIILTVFVSLRRICAPPFESPAAYFLAMLMASAESYVNKRRPGQAQWLTR
jgi:hypothetical protein